MTQQKPQSLNSQELETSNPATENASRSVMLKASRDDQISVEKVASHLKPEFEIPQELCVVRRSETYYGPKLETEAGDECYLITAPGPNTQLLLWKGQTNNNGYLVRWERLAEIQAKFSGNIPQYDVCIDCGEPIKSAEHERMAAFGPCPGFDS